MPIAVPKVYSKLGWSMVKAAAAQWPKEGKFRKILGKRRRV